MIATNDKYSMRKSINTVVHAAIVVQMVYTIEYDSPMILLHTHRGPSPENVVPPALEVHIGRWVNSVVALTPRLYC